jgi:hypothetical protein
MVGAMRTLILTALAALPLAAGEAAPAEPKAEARALHARSLRDGDLWTAIQLESWGRRNALRLGPVTGASELHGEPLLGFPEAVRLVLDRGRTVGVFAGSRLHQVAPDGRPLTPSTPFGFHIERAGWSGDGRFAGAARIDRPDLLTHRLRVAVRSTPAGAILLDQGVGVVAGDHAASEVAVSGDGTAAAVEVSNHPLGQPRVAVVRADGANQLLPGLRDPLAVGTRGGWFIARRASDNALVMVRGGRQEVLLAAADGPGWTAIIAADARRLQLVAPDGSLREVPPAIGIGNDPRLAVRGDWLALHSGGGARTLPGRDALDREVPGGQPQPPTLAAWRTAELADAAAAPRLVRAMPWSPANHLTAAWFAWDGPRAWIVDLSGDEPIDLPLPSTGAAIAWIDTDLNLFAKIRRQDGTCALVDRIGRSWYDGEGRDIWAQEQRRAIVAVTASGGGRAWALAGLDPDPGKRTRVPLQLDPEGWDEIYADRDGRRVVATAWSRSAWVEIDPANGRERRRGSTANLQTPRPGVDRLWGTPVGRWQAWQGRLLDKADGETALVPGRIFAPRDAWRIDRAVIAVTHDHRVAITGRRPGEWLDLGPVDQGEPWFGIRRARQEVVIRANGSTVADLGPGPRLVPPGPGEVEDLPEGAWRVRGLRIAAPRQGDFVWDEERTGFTPDRLRGPYPDRLLVITRSVLINLDPASVRTLFKVER